MRKIWIGLLIVSLASCKTGIGVSSGGAKFDTYQEEITLESQGYPDFREAEEGPEELPPSIASEPVEEELQAISRKIASANSNEAYIEGFRVLVYSGLDRDQAFSTQRILQDTYANITPEMEYQQPRYFVKVGNYAYKVEALKVLYQLKPEFPMAIIIRDRIKRETYSMRSQL